jgi:rhodanese-related sulfurtransferase
MDRWWSDGTERGGVLWGGVIAIVVVGAFLGIFQNALVRAGSKDDGLAWQYQPPKLETLEEILARQNGGTAPQAAASVDPADNVPFKIPAGVDDIPDLGKPVEVTVTKVRELVDRKAAVIIDARDAPDYAAGHIPGAINMPFDEFITDTARLEAFDQQGKPILVYCGGVTCELSMKLGYALVAAGKTKVLVYTGGWPEWTAMQYPVEQGAKPEGA